MASHPHLAVSYASVSSTVRVSIAQKRRTRHPSGSRLIMVTSRHGQATRPWHLCAPENLRLPCACPIVRITDHVVTHRLHPYAGSRQRRHLRHKSVRGLLLWAEARTNQILWIGSTPFARLNDLSPTRWAGVNQKLSAHHRAPADASSSHKRVPTCAPPLCEPLALCSGPVCVDNPAAPAVETASQSRRLRRMPNLNTGYHFCHCLCPCVYHC